MIFVHIYSYCDLELGKTVEDLFAKADNPDDIRVGVLNADDEDYVYKGEYIVDIINKPYEEYHGCGRACHEIQTQLYKGEDWYFKIDPHSRFTEGWDTELLSHAGKNKVLTSRCLGYHLDGKFDKRKKHYTVPVNWHNVEVIQLTGRDTDQEELKSYFMQAGCIFAPKEWAQTVLYDPNIPMWGEETDLSMRTFLAGFDIITVPPVVYHLYGRQNRKRVDSSKEFETANRIGIERVKIKLGNTITHNPIYLVEWDKYGCDGTVYRDKIQEIINAGGYDGR